MERKSESICSWAVAKIKSLLGLSVPVKKFLDTLPELQTTNIIDFLDDESTMKLAFASKTMNSKIKAYRTRKFEEENLLDCILAILGYEDDEPALVGILLKIV